MTNFAALTVNALQGTIDIDKLCRNSYRPLCLYALHFVKDTDLAEEFVQESFVTLWSRLNEGKDVRNPEAYLNAMVRNRCLLHLRQSGSSASMLDISSLSSEETEKFLSDEEDMACAEMQAKIWFAVDRLPEMRRKVLLMSKRDGLSYAEIAAELGLSVNTVRNHVSRALAALRRDTGLSEKTIILILSDFLYFS